MPDSPCKICQAGPISQSILPKSARWLPAGTFANSICLVTGCGTGSGLEISRGLAALGATVTIASRNPNHHGELLEKGRKQGWATEAEVCDVREAEAVRNCVEAVVARHARIDHLINNAAGNFICAAERLSVNAWRAVLGIVFDGEHRRRSEAGGECWDERETPGSRSTQRQMELDPQGQSQQLRKSALEKPTISHGCTIMEFAALWQEPYPRGAPSPPSKTLP